MASPVEQRVRAHESRIRAMFDAIAPDYDRLNHSLSFGQDLLWRLATARRARLAAGEVALDVGTGTGDLALALLRASAPSSRVVGVDPGAYAYLPDALTPFPDVDVVARLMRDAGFREVRYTRLTFGIATIHEGTR